jgi:hypothetical protein
VVLIILTIWMAFAFASPARAQAPTLTQVYGPARVPPGCRALYCPAPGFTFLPPFLVPPPVAFYDPAPVMAPQPLLVDAPPVEPPPAYAPSAPLPLGWIFAGNAPCTDPSCSALIVQVFADGLNFRAGPGGPVLGAIANGTPVLPIRREGNWVLVAAGCPLAPTYTWSVTTGLPLSVCL